VIRYIQLHIDQVRKESNCQKRALNESIDPCIPQSNIGKHNNRMGGGVTTMHNLEKYHMHPTNALELYLLVKVLVN
jgi:hypothetical protein